MDCTISKTLNIKCRMYDICKSPLKDKEAELCKVRFDYEFQARRNLIFGLSFDGIEDMQSKNKNQ